MPRNNELMDYKVIYEWIPWTKETMNEKWWSMDYESITNNKLHPDWEKGLWKMNK